MARKKNTSPAPKPDKAAKAAERQARARANYDQLRAAGFSSKDAARYRYSAADKVRDAIQARQLPEIKQNKRGARRKVETSQIQHPYVLQQSIKLDYFGDAYLRQIENYMKLAQGQGFTDYSLVLTFTSPSGQQTHASTPMDSIADLDDLGEAIAAAADHFMARYKTSTEEPMVEVEIQMWNYASKGKRAG